MVEIHCLRLNEGGDCDLKYASLGCQLEAGDHRFESCRRHHDFHKGNGRCPTLGTETLVRRLGKVWGAVGNAASSDYGASSY
jgi:hypothetical protein